MTDQATTQKAKAASLSIRQAIGFETPEGTNWSLVHGQQYAVLKDRVVARVLLHLVSFALVVFTVYQTVPVAALAAWGLGLISAVLYSARADIRLGDADSRSISVTEMESHALTTAAKGAMWSVGLILCAVYGQLGDTLLAWTIAAMLVL
ncbi:MAG TPA: hypothetical protein DHU71_00420, partial [Erythrobacter sp.]|nr:hypothetical protein [Erythrobacter sp.]